MGPLKQGMQYTVFGHAIHHAVGSDDRRVDGAGENQDTDDHNEDAECNEQDLGANQIHRKPAEQVVGIGQSDIVRNDHRGE